MNLIPVTDARANSEPYSSLFSYLFGRGGGDVSRRSDRSQSTLGSEFLGRKKRAYDAAANADDAGGFDRLATAKRAPGSEFLGKRMALGGGRWGTAALAKRMGSGNQFNRKTIVFNLGLLEIPD